ncbi:uncharacterized protein [Ambystoma mexicanum]|uniref:uncharacterized protein isoform X2 n=1 Tax=Ambystoma mexicanum TaxID=8296 RepID=UPI0037E964E1
MDLCKSLQIERSGAAAYHLQTNGLDEKTNHNIKRAYLKVVNEKQNNWNQFLLPILFSLRSKKHSSTNFTPFQLMYGREAVFPCELPVTYALDQILMAEESDYVKGKEEQDVKRKETRARVAENVGVAQRIQQDTYKKRVLKRSGNMSVNVGDKVLLLNARNKSRKGGVLGTKCLGPYIIRSLEGKKVYLTTMEGQDLRKMININHIKLFRDKVTQQDSTAADHQDMQVPGNTEDSNTAEEMQTGEDAIESLETEISTRVEHEGDKPCSGTSFPPRLEAMVGPHKIYDTSLHILQNRGWISEEVIDAYLHVLILKMHPGCEYVSPHCQGCVHGCVKQAKFQAISSCVSTSILGGRYRNASYKKFPLQNSDELLCPYNTGNHWMFVIIALKDRKRLLIDPMGEEGQHSRRILQNWRNFLRSHFPENLTPCSWKVEHCAHETQQDGFNCGPLILKFAETYLCGGELKDVPTKTSDLDDFRNHIAMEATLTTTVWLVTSLTHSVVPPMTSALMPRSHPHWSIQRWLVG